MLERKWWDPGGQTVVLTILCEEIISLWIRSIEIHSLIALHLIPLHRAQEIGKVLQSLRAFFFLFCAIFLLFRLLRHLIFKRWEQENTGSVICHFLRYRWHSFRFSCFMSCKLVPDRSKVKICTLTYIKKWGSWVYKFTLNQHVRR